MKNEILSSMVRNLLQIAIVAAVSFVFFFFIVPNQPGRGGGFAVYAVSGGMAMRACWNQRHYAWFWFALACVFVVQGAVIFFIPWSTERFPGIILVPVGLADFAFVYGILTFVQKLRPQG
jgi:hypothetical protein